MSREGQRIGSFDDPPVGFYKLPIDTYRPIWDWQLVAFGLISNWLFIYKLFGPRVWVDVVVAMSTFDTPPVFSYFLPIRG